MEAIVKCILMGTFNGIARGDGTNFIDPLNQLPLNEVNEVE